MRIMAIDYGDARSGVAVSDETSTLTGDAFVIQSRDENITAQSIIDEVKARGVSRIIVGYPKNMDGTIGPRAVKSEQLVEVLRTMTDIEIILWDERLTTKSAHQILSETGRSGKKRKNTIDAVAAALILESYLRSL